MKRREFVGAGLTFAAAWPIAGWSTVLKGVAEQAAKDLDGHDLTLKGSVIEDFAARLRGDLLMSSSPAYDARRRLWNAMFDRKPALIACCTGAADVKSAVDFAREHRLLTAVRAGGHSFSGKSTCEGGLVIDLQSMQGVRVDPKAKRAYLEAGSLLGQLDHECAAHGLATTAGTVSHTGAAGLTLGGGFGRLGRRFGYACDNVASFEVVTADGRFLRAADDENADLYWGLRGGGGNFGVVTAIEYRVHPVDPVILGGNITWPIAQARDVFRHYRDIATSAPEVLNLEFGLLPTPDGPVANIEVCWSGDRAKGDTWLQGLRGFGKPAADTVAPMPYVKIQQIFDEADAFGQYFYAKNGFMTALDDAGIDLVLDVFARNSDLFALFVDPCDAAYHRLPVDATAFPNRDAIYWLGIFVVSPKRDGFDPQIERTRAAWREIEPLIRGFYTNVADADTPLASYRENYGAHLERLVTVKGKYDPMNLFRLNANVPPKI
jgi:FAD binding domain/Berberine and berberine like